MSNIKLGIFGFGCVGTGLYQVLNQSKGLDAEIKKICIKDDSKSRSIDSSFFTTDKNELLNDDDIDIIVELIDDADAALDIVKTAFKKGKHVVSANKKMIAENLQDLLDLQEEAGVSFLYEGSCCASIPIIRNLEEYYDNDMLSSVSGIFNGSTNFILSKMTKEGGSYNAILKEAQDLGFAESDPALDVEGIDAKYKLGIILFHAFGLVTNPESIFNYGITKVNEFDLEFAKQRGLGIKLIANCSRKENEVNAICAPTFVKDDSPLYTTNNEYNAVVVESAFSQQQTLVGKGAGDKPTGSAVLSDISALTYDYKYENKKSKRNGKKLNLSSNANVDIYVRYAHQDKPDFSIFKSIQEQYAGKNGKYVIGTVNQGDLENAKWIHDEAVNIILMN